jgi:predicted nuclease of predicted toxin-antitoxin system
MRYLLDACVHGELCVQLRALGADAIVFPGKPGTPDIRLLEFAASEERILITNGKDFGDLVIRKAHRFKGVVLVRTEIASLESAEAMAQRIMSLPNGGTGTFNVIETNSIRTRNIEIPPP